MTRALDASLCMMYTQVQSRPHKQHGTQGADPVKGEGSTSEARGEGAHASDTGWAAAFTGLEEGTEMGTETGFDASLS